MGAVPFQSQELVGCMNRFRKTEAGVADGTVPKNYLLSLFCLFPLDTENKSYVCTVQNVNICEAFMLSDILLD